MRVIPNWRAAMTHGTTYVGSAVVAAGGIWTALPADTQASLLAKVGLKGVGATVAGIGLSMLLAKFTTTTPAGTPVAPPDQAS